MGSAEALVAAADAAAAAALKKKQEEEAAAAAAAAAAAGCQWHGEGAAPAAADRDSESRACAPARGPHTALRHLPRCPPAAQWQINLPVGPCSAGARAGGQHSATLPAWAAASLAPAGRPWPGLGL